MGGCTTCGGQRWVCETHGSGWDGSAGDCCEAGPGIPCPACNVAPAGAFPAYPPGSVLLTDFQGRGVWEEN